jgi:hypothetical protein
MDVLKSDKRIMEIMKTAMALPPVPAAAFLKLKDVSLVWCPGQNIRIAPLSFFNGCRKRRLKD